MSVTVTAVTVEGLRFVNAAPYDLLLSDQIEQDLDDKELDEGSEEQLRRTRQETGDFGIFF